MFHRVGLQNDEPPRTAGLLFSESSGFVETRVLNSQTPDANDHTPFLRKRNPRFVIFWGFAIAYSENVGDKQPLKRLPRNLTEHQFTKSLDRLEPTFFNVGSMIVAYAV